MARTIESPGVEIKEFDLSLRASLPVGTNIFVQGFADQGPTDELINVTSITEFEQIYGMPKNAAERYFYHSSKQVLESSGNLLTNRFPYGSGDGAGYSAQYSALVFPVSTIGEGYGTIAATPSSTTFDAASGYVIGTPTQITLSETERLAWEAGNISWTDTPNGASVGAITGSDAIGNAGIIVINDMKTTIDNIYAGYYVGIHDNQNLQDTTYDSISSVKYYDTDNSENLFPVSMLDTNLSGDETNNSISEDLETIANDYGNFDDVSWDDSIILGLFKATQNSFSTSDGVSLRMTRRESYVGSLDASRKESPNGTEETFFIENITNDGSVFMNVMVNPNLAEQTNWNLTGGGRKQVRISDELKSLYALGARLDSSNIEISKYIGNLPQKLARSLRLADNTEQIPIDIVVDGGLSTIHTTVAAPVANDNDSGVYKDTDFLDNVFVGVGANIPLNDQAQGSSSQLKLDWSVVYNRLNNFCAETRKDCLFIADPLKHIFVQKDLKTLQNSERNFSSDIYWSLKNLFGSANSNYACTYGNWVKVYDDTLGAHTWLPFSGFEAKIMANMDANLQPWYAPAGLNNGIITGISDLALNPTQKQRDLLYRISVNPVVYFPGDGYVVWGQKTLQKKPSAFDRINVRRLFLTLEKATNAVMRYFVFEPNTVFTRTRVVNILSPIFEVAQNNEGIYSYLLVCDERNNTPNVIDNNELVVDIYLKPVRTSEYILVNFYATRTDQDFTELI